MKKISIILVLFIAISSTSVLANNLFANSESNNTSNYFESFKIINDTDADVQIHTGSGFVEINKTSSTSITCEAGKEIRLANKEKKGDVLFVVDSSMCGKVVKLSKYL
jgi:hypothetical protein